MPNKRWSDLSPLQLGRYAEYYAKMEFASYGFEVYTSEVDDHGVDFVAKHPKDQQFYEVQVKSIRNTGYIVTRKDKVNQRGNWLLCLLRFIDDEPPEVYIIPVAIWTSGKHPFVNRDYEKEGQTSKPEWGINVSKKNIPALSEYLSNQFFCKWQ